MESKREKEYMDITYVPRARIISEKERIAKALKINDDHLIVWRDDEDVSKVMESGTTM